MAIEELTIGTSFSFVGRFYKQFFPKGEMGEYSWGILSFNSISSTDNNKAVVNKCKHPIFKTITVMGMFPKLELGVEYNITAEVKEGRKEGEKILNVLDVYETINLLETKTDAYKFLKGILTPTQVENLFEELDNPIEAIKTKNVELLTSVKGVGEKTAKVIINKYIENLTNANLIVLLHDCDITTATIQSLVKSVGSPITLKNMITNNPYSLTKFKGIGFKRADTIALKLGVEWNDLRRLEAYILYKLEEGGENGFSWLSSFNLIDLIQKELGNFTIENIVQAISKLKKEDKIWNGKKGIVASKKYYMLEREIALELARIQLGEKDVPKDWKERLKLLEETMGWEYTEEQRQAIENIVTKTLCVVTGGAGTGKTTTVLGAKKALDNLPFAQCCLAGKGASRMHESTGHEASTIHRLLQMSMVSNESSSLANITYITPKENKIANSLQDLVIRNSKSSFAHNSHHKLDNELIFIDEFPMIGGELFLSILKAIKTGTTLVLIGDFRQLPAIGSLNIGRDLIGHPCINTSFLTKIHRQAQDSDIIMKSKDVGEGKQLFPINYIGTGISGKKQDFEWDIYSDKNLTISKVVNYFQKYLPKANDIMELQILAPTKKSVSAINRAIKNVYNPHKEGQVFIEKKDEVGMSVKINIGDKVINTKNNYGSRVYKTSKEDTAEVVDIFNGFVGEVMDIMDNTEDDTKELIIYYPIVDKKVIVNKEEWSNSIQLAYAITTHKSQGSEFDYVICAIDMSHYGSLMSAGREMVYTMFTRASKHLVVVAQNSALKFAIDTTSKNFKQTFLPMMLNSALSYVKAKMDFFKKNKEIQLNNDNSIMSDVIFQVVNKEYRELDLEENIKKV